MKFRGYARKTDHPLYATWNAMLNRCTRERSPQYPYYGGRGIKVCKRWDSFENFLDDIGREIGIDKPTLAHTLDRIDNMRGYEPGNVRWSSKSEQAKNRRKRTDRLALLLLDN